MHRRGIGVGAVKNKNLAQARYKDKGNVIAEDQLAQMAKQMETFKVNLEEFATKHKDQIKKDPAFRVQFQEMCASIGVDPLASSKGFWSEMLGVGDFYYELAVKIVEVCMATSHQNGGLIRLDELKSRLEVSRHKNTQEISIDDLLRAIRKLKTLGNGFTIHPIGKTFLIQSVPGELTMDHTTVLQHAQKSYYVTVSGLVDTLKWEKERAIKALEYMLKEGLAWVDDQAEGERQYWFPTLFPDAQTP